MPSENRARLAAEYSRVVSVVHEMEDAELVHIMVHLVQEGVPAEAFLDWPALDLKQRREKIASLIPKADTGKEPQKKKATMPKDPKWKPRARKEREIPYLAARPAGYRDRGY